MTEHCPDHNYLVQTVGEMNGKMDMIIDGQREVRKDLSDLYGKFNENKTSSEIQKTKLAPVFWFLIIVGGYVLAELVKRFFKV